MTELTQFLKKLISLPGLSGYEAPVREAIAETWRPLVDELSVSRVGSLHGLVRGSGAEPRPRIMIATHMDAIGLMVTMIVDGLLRVTQVGGVDPRILPGQPVLVHGRKVLPAIVVQPPDNLVPDRYRGLPMPMEYLFVDTGLLPEEVTQLVRPGDPVSFAQEPLELSGETIVGHTLDNRASVAALTCCLQELKHIRHSWDVYAVATVQEEETFAGGYTSPFDIRPDIAIAVDVTFAKGPGANDYKSLPLGKGVALGWGPNIHPAIYKGFKDLAERLDVPTHFDPMPVHSGTDAYPMQVVQEGIPTMALGIPLRYMHTPVELTTMKDITRTGMLLAEYIARLEPDAMQNLRWEDYSMLTQDEILSQAPRIGEEQIALLEKLSNAGAVSGDEGEVRALVLEQIKPLVDECRVDALGNILAVKHAAIQNPTRVMLSAHMDEVGLMLVNKDEGGLFNFEKIGGLDVRQLVGKPVLVGKKHVPGVIGARPIHLTTAEERGRAIPIDAMRIDLGPGGAELAKPGERAVFATRFRQVGPSLLGKAMDNRVGVTTLIELIRHAPANIELLAAFTVQEEIGLRGARVAAYAFNPDLALVLDCTPANDLPVWDGSENARYNTRLGAGPAVYTADGATLGDPRLVRLLTETGDQFGLPYQRRQPGGGGTDGGAIHKQRAGIPVVSLSVPGRYLHTAVGMIRLSDWQQTLTLAFAALCRIERSLLEGERR